MLSKCLSDMCNHMFFSVRKKHIVYQIVLLFSAKLRRIENNDAWKPNKIQKSGPGKVTHKERHKKSNLKTLVSFVEQQPYSSDKATPNRLLGRQVFNLKIWNERAQFYSFIKHFCLESEGAGAFFFFCKVDSQTARNYIYTDILNSMLSIILSYVIIKWL